MTKSTEEDRALWRKVASTVRPLHRAGARIGGGRSAAGERAYVPAQPIHPARLRPLTTTSRADIDASTLRKLRAGEFQVAGRLDLHGLTQQQAHASLIRFVHRGYHDGRRCILVITGRSGILREQTPRWLNEDQLRPYILSIAPARPGDGGVGALYVLLRRRRV